MKIRKPSPATVIAMTALVVALGGVAFAAIPDSNGTINACYQKRNGDLRVVDVSNDCRGSERALAWNQQGPAGTTGATGPTGPGGSGGTGSGNVIGRARSTQSVSTVSTPVEHLGRSNIQGTQVPMSGNSWTQGATEIDTFYGKVTYRKPFAGHCSNAVSSTGVGKLEIIVTVDGSFVTQAGSPHYGQFDPADPPGTYTRNLILDGYLFEPGSARANTLTVEVGDNCGDGNHFVVESVAIDIVAFQ